MKKYMMLTALALIICGPTVAFAQGVPQGNSAPPEGPSAGGGRAGSGEEFQEHKTKILARMNEHLAEIQKRIACVQSASNHEVLRACLPEKGEGHKGEGHWEHSQGMPNQTGQGEKPE